MSGVASSRGDALIVLLEGLGARGGCMIAVAAVRVAIVIAIGRVALGGLVENHLVAHRTEMHASRLRWVL